MKNQSRETVSKSPFQSKSSNSRTHENVFSIMECSMDLICVIDKMGTFVLLSDACKRILGYSKEELTEKGLRNVYVKNI